MPLSILRHHELILRLVKRDLKVRYKSSSLGVLWSLAKPLMLVVIYTIVFDKVLGIGVVPTDTPETRTVDFPYALFIMAGLIPWTFFAASLGESLTVILSNANLVKKVRLPLEVFPISTVIGNLIHFALAMVVVFAFMAWEGVYPTALALWLPVLVLIQTMLAVGFALMLSALNVFYRDIASLMEVALTGWLYATPIIYSLHYVAIAVGERLPPWLFTLYMLNPMAPLVLAYRRVLLYATPQGTAGTIPAPEYAAMAGAHPDIWLAGWVGVSALISIGVLAVGMWVFRHYAKAFADEV